MQHPRTGNPNIRKKVALTLNHDFELGFQVSHKTPMKLKFTQPKSRKIGVPESLIAALLVCLSESLSYAIDNVWTGATDSDWNVATNWSEGGVPDTTFGDNAIIDGPLANIATINADIAFTPRDIVVRGGGRVDHRAGIAGTFDGAWIFVGQDATPSFYNLADTSTEGAGISGFAQGTGTLNATGNLQVASWGTDRTGSININTTGAVNVAGGLFIANDNGCIGVMNLESGAVVVSHSPGFASDNTLVGHNGGNGTLNIAGGSFAASRNFRVGNEGGAGTLNVTGGTLTISGTDDIFVGRERGSGVVNQSGGTVDFGFTTIIGDGNNSWADTAGTYNLSGGVLNVRRGLIVGREGAGSTAHTGTLHVTGGTLEKTGDEKTIVGLNRSLGTVVHSGGTITLNNALVIGSDRLLSQALGIRSDANDGKLEKRSEWAPDRVDVQSTTDWNAGIGEWYGSGLLTTVIPFKIPDFGPVDAPFTSATFGVNLYQKGGSTVTDVDLYAVRVSDFPAIAASDWYNGANPDPNATLLQASFLTPDSTTTSVGALSGANNFTSAEGSAALLAYLNNAYAGGAGAGKYVFLRLSYGSDTYASGWDAYSITTRDASKEGDHPVINYTTTYNIVDAPPPTDTPLSGIPGIYTLSGNASLTVQNEIAIGELRGTGVLNLNGGSLTARNIEGGTGSATVNFNGTEIFAPNDASGFIENLDVANIQIGGLIINSNGFNVTTSQVFSGPGGLVKTGAGQLTLRGENNYTGSTTVSAGTLRLEKSGLNAVIDSSANTLVVEFTTPPSLGSHSILNGALSGNQTFSATGLAAGQQASFNHSTGIVTITDLVADPYVNWIEGYTPNALLADAASKLADADPDRDGINNLLEFALGGNPVEASPAVYPTLETIGNDLVLGYTRPDVSETVTTQVGQWSTDLEIWNDVTPVLVNENGALDDDMMVIVPRSNALNGRLFLRLKVTKP